jgi:hypothetical protein
MFSRGESWRFKVEGASGVDAYVRKLSLKMYYQSSGSFRCTSKISAWNMRGCSYLTGLSGTFAEHRWQYVMLQCCWSH